MHLSWFQNRFGKQALPGKDEVLFHRSPLVLLQGYVAGCIPLSLVYLIANYLSRSSLLPVNMDQQLITTIYRCLCTLLALEYIRQYFDDLYVFGSRRIIHFAGRLSFRYRRSSIAYGDIREIKVHQTVFGRLVGYGTLKFGTASTKRYEIEFKDISSPVRLSGAVESRVQESRSKGGTVVAPSDGSAIATYTN